MVGATRHGLPLVWGFTGYPAAHEPILRRAIGVLDRPGALAQIVDMALVRWVLLRPARDWADPGQRVRILELAGLEPVSSLDGWDLLRVDLEPVRPGTYWSIAAGPRPGLTPLGTPVDGPKTIIAGVRVDASPRRVAPGGVVHIEVSIENLSKEPWPATDASGNPAGVQVVVERGRIGVAGSPETFVFSLPWDLSPGSTVRLPIDLTASGPPATWRVTAFPFLEHRPSARLQSGTRPGEDQYEVEDAAKAPGAGQTAPREAGVAGTGSSAR